VPVGLEVDGCGDVHEQGAAEIAEDSLDAAERHEVHDQDQRDDGQQDQRRHVDVEQQLQDDRRSPTSAASVSRLIRSDATSVTSPTFNPMRIRTTSKIGRPETVATRRSSPRTRRSR